MAEKNNKKILEELNSPDPSVRRNTIEQINNCDLDEEFSDKLCELLEDPDNGVKDAAFQLFVRLRSNLLILKLTNLIFSENIALRNLAGEILYRIGKPAVFSLLQKLENANENDQKFIIDLLGQIGDASAEKYIIKVLKNSVDSNIKLSCIEALGNIGLQSSIDYIIELFGQEEIYNASVLEAMGKIGGDKVLEFMLGVFDNSDYLSKYSIIESLKSIGDEKSFFFLLNKMNDLDGALLFAAIDTINSLRQKYGFDVPHDEKMRNLILTAVDTTDLQFKKAALELAIQFDDKQLNDYMFKIYGLDTELDNLIAGKAIEKPLEFLSGLADYLENNKNNGKEIIGLINFLILNSLEQVLEPDQELLRRKVANTLSKYLLHSDEEVRRMCIELIFTIDNKNAVVLAESMLEDEIVWNRLRVIELLAQNNFKMPQNILSKLLNDEDEMIRQTVQQLYLMETKTLSAF